MAPTLPGKCLEIIPLYLARNDVNDQDVRPLDRFMGMCRCSFEILYLPNQGGPKLLHRAEDLCYVTEYPNHESTNAIGLHFVSPFSIDVTNLDVLIGKSEGMVRDTITNYQFRFRFSHLNQGEWLPMNLSQLIGLDPAQRQPKAIFSTALSLPITSPRGESVPIDNKLGEPQEFQPFEKRRSMAGYLRIRCCWTERVRPVAPAYKSMSGTPNLIDPNIPSTLIPYVTSIANVAVPTIKVPEPPLRPRPKARYRPQNRASKVTTIRRRSKRLEALKK